ncbi:MAG: hypothetical protein P9L92_00685 [Candidatus Electryonea clarkiae]|nr:hypothetical protein [Candidatus Electryonea clarkiae]MDP8287094.1 hypothetical protein [Candidatus Electryonea clarkiae]
MIRHIFHIIIVSVVISIPVVFINCSINNPMEDFRIIVKGPALGTSFAGRFVNTADGLPIFDSVVEVNIEGPDKEKIANLSNTPKVQFKAPSGFLSFSLLKDIIPSEEEPVEFIVVAHAEDYVSTSKRFVITEPDDYDFSIRMVNIENTPPGVSAVIDSSGIVENGFLDRPIILTTESVSEEGKSQGATVSIPANIILRDAEGNFLIGRITTSLVHFTTQDEQSVSAFPGGFEVEASIDGQQEEVLFFTGGFAAIDMVDEEGRSAHTLENGKINIQMDLDNELLNPETGEIVQSGDEIGTWSYDDLTGEWAFEGNIEVMSGDGSGQFGTSFDVTHLTWWNLDWKGNTCPSGVSLVFTGGGNFGKTIRLSTENPYQWMRENTTEDNRFNFRNFPLNVPIKIEVNINGFETIFATTITVTDCDHTFEINIPESGDLVDYTCAIRAYCKDDPDIRFGPSIPVYYKLSSEEIYAYGGVMDGGEFTFENLIWGEKYQFMGVYEDQPPFVAEQIVGLVDTFYIEYPLDESFCDGEEPGYNSRLIRENPWGLVTRHKDGYPQSFPFPYYMYFSPGGTGNYHIQNQLYPLVWSTYDHDLMLFIPNGLPRMGTFEVIDDGDNVYLEYDYDINSRTENSSYNETYVLMGRIGEIFDIIDLHSDRTFFRAEVRENGVLTQEHPTYLQFQNSDGGFGNDGVIIDRNREQEFSLYNYIDTLFWDESLWEGERKIIQVESSLDDTSFTISSVDHNGATLAEEYVPLYHSRLNHTLLQLTSHSIGGTEYDTEKWILLTADNLNQFTWEDDEMELLYSVRYNDEKWLFQMQDFPSVRRYDGAWNGNDLELSRQTVDGMEIETFRLVNQDETLSGTWRLTERLVDGTAEPPESIDEYLQINSSGILARYTWSAAYDVYINIGWKYWFINSENEMWFIVNHNNPVLISEYNRINDSSFSISFEQDREEIVETYEFPQPPGTLQFVPPSIHGERNNAISSLWR